MGEKKQGSTKEGLTSSGLFQQADQLMGTAGGVDPTAVDVRLLWAVLQLLTARKASIQLGVTQDNSAWAVQYWDGKLPVKYYYRSTDELNRAWAALLRAGYGREVTNELNELIMTYGW